VSKRNSPSDDAVPLALTAAERKLILDDLLYLEKEYEQVVRETPANEPLRFTLDDWEGLGGCIAAEANHTDDPKLKRKLDRLFAKINKLLDEHPDDLGPELKVFPAAGSDATAKDAGNLAEKIAVALSFGDMLCTVKKMDPIEVRSRRCLLLELADEERAAIVERTVLADDLKSRLGTAGHAIQVSINDMAAMAFALAEAMEETSDPQLLRAAVTVIQRCMAGFQEIAGSSAPALRPRKASRSSNDDAETFPVNLTQSQRRVVAQVVPSVAERMRLEETNARTIRFTLAELKEMELKCRAAIGEADSGMVRNSLRHAVDAAVKARNRYQGNNIARIPAAQRIYQLKITLKGIEPPIWRRIQVRDCTLDRLHEHIQLAMGWQNCHLYEFKIDAGRFGDPRVIEDCEDLGDATVLHLEEFVPENGKRFRFHYEYDFGDCWEHEVLFEGCLRASQGVRYPLCLEGERACPPEDVGGTTGYRRYVKAMADPEDEEHKEYLGWRGPYDPERFDAQKTTKKMRRGLPKWEDEEEGWL
jgi:hypothetical protein